MRHFSGEFEGIRLLMADELDAIAGGDGEDTDDNTPPPPPDQINEIVVTAGRSYIDYQLGQLFHFNGFGSTPTGGSYDPYNQDIPDCRQTQVEYDVTATNGGQLNGAEAEKFSSAIEQQSDRMRGMPTSLSISGPLGTFTTGTELKALWSKSDFIVTGTAPQPGYGGSAGGNGGNPLFTVYDQYLPSYMANDATEAWYFFHELAHTTANGKVMNAAAYTAWEAAYNANPAAAGLYKDSIQFANNERVMNTVAANIASQFGINLRTAYSNVDHGYLSNGYEVSGTGGSITPDIWGSGPGGTCR